MDDMTPLVQPEQIEQAILLIRGQRVMLDRDLAVLYGVKTKTLNRAVLRNLDRFPVDFMFQLTGDEAKDLRCQIGTSNADAFRPWYRAARRQVLSEQTGWAGGEWQG